MYHTLNQKNEAVIMKTLSPWVTLLLIFALFLVPLLLAWFMYTGAFDFHPQSTRNYGILVEPQIAVTWTGLELENHSGDQGRDENEYSVATALKGHWVILYPVRPSCDNDCISRVTLLRQVHRAAGRNMDRVRIALVAQGWMDGETMAKLSAVYPHFMLISDPDGFLSNAMASADAAAGNHGDSATYLIDPLGNLMMLYGAESDPNDLNKDLKLLLKWSKLDK